MNRKDWASSNQLICCYRRISLNTSLFPTNCMAVCVTVHVDIIEIEYVVTHQCQFTASCNCEVRWTLTACAPSLSQKSGIYSIRQCGETREDLIIFSIHLHILYYLSSKQPWQTASVNREWYTR